MVKVEPKKVPSVDYWVGGLNWAILIAAIFMIGYLTAKGSDFSYNDEMVSKISRATGAVVVVALLGGCYQYATVKDGHKKASMTILNTLTYLLYLLWLE